MSTQPTTPADASPAPRSPPRPSWLEPIGGDFTSPRGFLAAGVHCGIKSRRPDLALLVAVSPAAVAGMFTTNRVQAAPVRYCREVVRSGRARAVLVNSGNANACTGERGLLDAREMATITAAELDVEPSEVLVCSTGVIGRPLPMDKLRHGIPEAVRALSDDGAPAAEAILTTDTRPKTAAARVRLAAGEVTIGGIAKGAGMIAPDLELPHATTLAFLSTDAAVPAPVLSSLLEQAMAQSFNCISIDGDTSTNDTVLLLASGSSGLEVEEASDRQRLSEGLAAVALDLAQQVVRDGEGAQRLIEVRVKGATDHRDARRVARTVAESPLVKTAFCAGEPNWGRFLMAIGRASARVIEERIGVMVGPLPVVAGGLGTEHDPHQLRTEMTRDQVLLEIDLGLGEGEAVMWTCDLTEEYVRINGRYLT